MTSTAVIPAEHWLRQPEAAAAICPSEGFWCTAFRVRLDGLDHPQQVEQAGSASPEGDGVPAGSASDGWFRVLREPPSREAFRTRPAWYGSPLLFPYPMGVSGNVLEYGGRRYPLRAGRDGRVVHGIVRNYPWTVERAWTDAGGDHVTAAISTAGNADMLAEFPFPFLLRATYTLRGRTLALSVEATNIGDATMPVGLGIHPYFSLPFVPAGRVADCVVRSDVTHVLHGTREWSAAAATPLAGGDYDLREAPTVAGFLAEQDRQPGGGTRVTVYARPPLAVPLAGSDAPAAASGGVRWSLEDVRHRVTVDVETEAAFQALVLFAPRPAALISPVPCTIIPNAVNLAARGVPGGVVDLAPGATWRTGTRTTASAGAPAGAA